MDVVWVGHVTSSLSTILHGTLPDIVAFPKDLGGTWNVVFGGLGRQCVKNLLILPPSMG
jgi:hypothetical protein